MRIDRILEKMSAQQRGSSRLVRLPDDRPIVFVGDTHGDREATERVLDRFSVPNHVIVFLGDTIDRGPDSLGNLERVLSETIAHPASVHLLMGNHEAWTIAPFSPADFWDRLDEGSADRLGEALGRLPYAAWHPAGVVATHGALPDVPSLDGIESIVLGSEAWRAIAWGDWESSDGGGLPTFGGRPAFGCETFERRMERIGARVLVRSHQPFAATYLFDNRCLTLFTSSAYGDGRRRVAVLNPEQTVLTARDLDLIEI
jgi:hypothetical protein